MTPLRVFLLLFSWSFLLHLSAQCPTMAEVRASMADSAFIPEAYARQLHERCPTAADTLGPAFYARSLYYNGLEDLDRAIAYGKYARTELQQADTTIQLGKISYNLGLFNLWSGDLREANWFFREASQLFLLIDHPQSSRRWLQSMEDLGYTYRQLGDYQRSEETLLIALKEAETVGNKNKMAHLQLKLGEVYEERGALGAAAGALNGAVAGFTELEDPLWRGISRISRVTLLRKQGETGMAYRELKDLLKQPETLSAYNLARAYSLGLLLSVDQGDLRSAEAYFEENLAVAQEVGDRQLEAQAWDNGGEAALKASDYPLAIERFTEAIGLLAPGFQHGPETPVPAAEQLAASPYNVNLMTYLGDLARAYRGAGQPQDALAALRAADLVADQIRSGLGGEQSALFWRSKALPVYEQAIELCYKLNLSEQGFYFFEKSRAILLLEGLAEADLMAGLPREVASSLVERERKLRAVQRALLQDDAATDSLQLALTLAREELLEKRRELRRQYPRLLPEGRMVEVVDLATAQANLKAAGVARQLQYFWGTDHIYLLVLTATEVEVVSLGRTAAIAPRVSTLLEYFTTAKAIDNDPEGYRQAATAVYQTYVAPAAAPPDANLLVLPDGLLGYVPFAALTTDVSGSYLLERNPISYAQSASVFGRKAPPGTNEALAFTPFVEALAGQSAAPLPFSVAEATALRDYYTTETFSGTVATRETLMEEANRYGILHLGTHAYATRSANDPPRILTATEPLFLPDVYGLDLPGTLVMLSACESNIGPLARGEGVLGFGRAFRAAGAGGVVASLWSLNDRAAADITTGFYASLASGTNKPQALHQAQLAYLNRTDLPDYLKSPYYWGALTYYGDAAVLPAPGRNPLWYGLAVFAVVAGGVFWRWRG